MVKLSLAEPSVYPRVLGAEVGGPSPGAEGPGFRAVPATTGLAEVNAFHDLRAPHVASCCPLVPTVPCDRQSETERE